MWKTKVRGVLVAGRSVYLTDTGACIGFKGPLVPTEQLLGDLHPDLAEKVRQAIPVITAHHERKAQERQQTAQEAVNSAFGYADDHDPHKMWGNGGGNALPDPRDDDEDFEDEQEFESGMSQEDTDNVS